MNNPSIESIKASIALLSDEDKHNLATDILRSLNEPYVVWMREDLENEAEQYSEYLALSEEDRVKVIDSAQDSYYWNALSDCTDQQWETVSMAVQEAVTRFSE